MLLFLEFKMVVPTGTARREAALELESLTDKPYEVDDCQAMSAKVQKMFWNLFPNITEETEPISRLTAMKSIHKMLEKLNNSKFTKSHNIVKAWKDYIVSWDRFMPTPHPSLLLMYL